MALCDVKLALGDNGITVAEALAARGIPSIFLSGNCPGGSSHPLIIGCIAKPFHNAALGDAALVDAMLQHPILINRPVVVSPLGVALCRPSERVLELLPQAQRGAFTKEDGERVVDDRGQRVPGDA